MFLVRSTPLRMNDALWVKFEQYQNQYQFTVRACENAVVKLVEAGEGSNTLYEIRIGAQSNTKIELWQEGAIIAEKNLLNILSIFEDRVFILQWQDNFLELIQGYDGRSVLSYTPSGIPNMEHIHGLTVEVLSECGGQWILPRYGGNLKIK